MNEPKIETNQEPVLCYVSGNFAYFTHAPLNLQWGDDWDDAPYEHNAGDPYSRIYGVDVEFECRIVKVAFESELQTPADKASANNSKLSVQDINALKAPWLDGPFWSGNKIAIMAGCTVSNFKKAIKQAGGRIWVEE
jgi:hypothetical protein